MDLNRTWNTAECREALRVVSAEKDKLVHQHDRLKAGIEFQLKESLESAKQQSQESASCSTKIVSVIY